MRRTHTQLDRDQRQDAFIMLMRTRASEQGASPVMIQRMIHRLCDEPKQEPILCSMIETALTI